MKYILQIVKGIIIILLLLPLIPLFLPLMLIDMVSWVGGADPMNTPIRRLIDKFTNPS